MPRGRPISPAVSAVQAPGISPARTTPPLTKPKNSSATWTGDRTCAAAQVVREFSARHPGRTGGRDEVVVPGAQTRSVIMTEMIRQFPETVANTQGAFAPRVMGRARGDGSWEGWLEFTPAGIDAANDVATGIETHQHDRV